MTMATMTDNLAIRAEIYHARLAKFLKFRINRVHIVHDPDTVTNIIAVVFSNGHKVTCPEHEILSDQFKATCLMVYDLPQLGT